LSFDPYLAHDGRIFKYNMHLDSNARKRKRVTHVRWFEPLSEGENSNKFIAVFEDGTLWVYFKESNHTTDSHRARLRFIVKPFQPGFPEVEKTATREQVLKWMEEHIESFNFEKFYPREFLAGK